VSPVPLGWGLSIAAGCLVAVLIGPYVPSWGSALAPTAALAVFGIGAWRLPEDERLLWVLRVSVGLMAGFVASTVPVTLVHLSESGLAAAELAAALRVTDAQHAFTVLTRLWIVMGIGPVLGLGALALRHKRTRVRV